MVLTCACAWDANTSARNAIINPRKVASCFRAWANARFWIVEYSLNTAYLFLPLNLASIFLLSYFAFGANSPYLFYGFDGRFEVSLITQSSLFVPFIFGYTNDFIHGLGNIWFTVNPHLIVSYVLSLTAPGIFTNFPLTYAICATELFLATYLVGRMIGISRAVASIASWVLVLLIFQYVGWNKIPSTFHAFPHYAMIAGISTLIAASLLLLGRAAPFRSVLLASLIFIGVTYIVLVAPTLLILSGPQFVIFGVVSLCSAAGGRDFFFRFALVSAIVALCLAFGYVHFIAGLVAYTAADAFRGLALRHSGLQEVSMLFWNWPVGRIANFFTVERTFVGLGLLGAFIATWRFRGTQRAAAIALLSTTMLFLGLGLLHKYWHFWFGPALWYFEGFLLPYHSLFGVALLSYLGCAALGVAAYLPAVVRLHPRKSPRVTFVLSLGIMIVPWGYVLWQQTHAAPPDLPYFAPHPQSETAITRILKAEAALTPGSEFRGRVATLTGRIFPQSANVSALTLWGVPDSFAMRTTGNSHQGAGLWQDSIPTLFEYNPLQTPPYFAFTRRFFTEPGDVQIRNLVAMRRIDPRLLAAVGVRFIITDKPYAGLHLREVLEVPVSQELLARHGVRVPIEDFKLYLYELGNANLGQYSPTEVRSIKTAGGMLEALADQSLDLSYTLVTEDDVPTGLVPAELQAFRVGRGQFTVQAVSSGRSVLLLPMEFSRCLGVKTNDSSTRNLRLIRADLIMTAVVFEDSIDATISYRSGPFVSSTCRLRDAADMKVLDIGNAFKDHQEFLPKGMFAD
jgi:hypothetical protein